MERDSGHHQGSVPSSKITISENALVADVGDEAVILNINNEHYYGLDKLSLCFWSWLKEDGDIDSVLARAVDAFDIDEKTLAKDLGTFVLELNNAGLLHFEES